MCRVNEEGLVLVGDFGLARDIYAAEYYRSSRQCKVPVKWMAPEALNDGISNEKTDIVSNACARMCVRVHVHAYNAYCIHEYVCVCVCLHTACIMCVHECTGNVCTHPHNARVQ